MGQGLFITGTDTGVGKTVIAAGLAAYYKAQGVQVAVMKPVQTGAISANGSLISEDLHFLLQAAQIDEPRELLNPYCFELASAPCLAAEVAGVKIEPGKIIKAYRELAARYELLIVEGAGGLLVPICDNYTFLELVQDLDLPLLIVGRAGLGTINHTALTVSCAQNRGITICGIILNHTQPDSDGLVEEHNPYIIRRLTGVQVLGVIPYSAGISVEQAELGNIAGLIGEHLDMG